jgi:predicted DNA-binding ribbon-helix-helix protein
MLPRFHYAQGERIGWHDTHARRRVATVPLRGAASFLSSATLRRSSSDVSSHTGIFIGILLDVIGTNGERRTCPELNCGTPSGESARLLLEVNYAWQGDVFDDDRPYLQIFEGLAPGADRIIAIPLTMEAPGPGVVSHNWVDISASYYRWVLFCAGRRAMVIGHSIIIDGHKTSVSLEEVYWKGLREIAEERGETLAHLIASIDTNRQNANLSSAIRHFVLGFYRHQLDLSRMVA